MPVSISSPRGRLPLVRAEKTRAEFRRILRPQGWVVAIWNFREMETPFAKAYEDILVKYGTDYMRVRDSYPKGHDVQNFLLGGEFLHHVLPNVQFLDWDGLAGRLRSGSYVPQEGHANFAPMMDALRELFRAHQEMAACEWSTPRTSTPGSCPVSGNNR